MRLEVAILGITAFFIYNAYMDGKAFKMFTTFRKYYRMIFYVFLGISAYLVLKNHPEQGRRILYHANNVVKFLPMDRHSMDLLSPIIDFTDPNSTNESFSSPSMSTSASASAPYFKTKRSVSETKKKYVAANQDWKCNSCGNTLDHTFEIDHKVRLEYGGSNEVDNLVALCRNCHGRKTAGENM
jgi:hypothetical protein